MSTTKFGQQKHRILIIDDEELLTKTFSRLLEKTGYEVLVAKNGQDALVMAENEDFHLVICDIRMPGLGGVETIRAMRNLSNGITSANVPVIFITGFADEKTETEANGLKPAAYLYKPFDNKELLTIVNRCLKA
jgi:DNA-binding response OmpR family regulator